MGHRFEQGAEGQDITVLSPRKPHGALLKGRVAREELPAGDDIQSPMMALKLLGIEYRLEDGCLQELN